MRLLSHISEFSKPHQVIMSEIIRCNLSTFINNMMYEQFRRKLYFLKIVAKKYLILLFAVAVIVDGRYMCIFMHMSP